MKGKFRSPMMMLLCVAVIFMALLIVRPSITYACSCVVPGAPLEALEQSAAVFSGTVVDTDKKMGLFISSADPVKVTFDVISSWKGAEGKQVTLTTALSSDSCGFEFTKGESYLVYANDYKESGKLQASLCSRTVELSSAGEDLNELGPGEEVGSGTEGNGSPGSDGNPTVNSGYDGSSTNIYVWMNVVIVAMLAIVFVMLYRRKRK